MQHVTYPSKPDIPGPTLTLAGRDCSHQPSHPAVRSSIYRLPGGSLIRSGSDSNRGSHHRERLEPGLSPPGASRTQALTAGSVSNPGSHHRERLEHRLSPPGASRTRALTTGSVSNPDSHSRTMVQERAIARHNCMLLHTANF